jgi:ribosomal protein S18 acetylase RimI-like enzyme
LIRRAEPDDTEWIRETAARVYAPLGDYRPIMAGWLELPGVTAYLDCDERTRVRRGFVLVGFYEAGGAPADLEQPGHPLPGTPLVADLIAIGVEPRFQRGGSGARLMGHALDLAFEAQKRTPVGQMLLTVAKTNKPALALFKRFGFEIVDAAHGSYDGGQPALRLGRRLDR